MDDAETKERLKNARKACMHASDATQTPKPT